MSASSWQVTNVTPAYHNKTGPFFHTTNSQYGNWLLTDPPVPAPPPTPSPAYRRTTNYLQDEVSRLGNRHAELSSHDLNNIPKGETNGGESTKQKVSDFMSKYGYGRTPPSTSAYQRDKTLTSPEEASSRLSKYPSILNTSNPPSLESAERQERLGDTTAEILLGRNGANSNTDGSDVNRLNSDLTYSISHLLNSASVLDSKTSFGAREELGSLQKSRTSLGFGANDYISERKYSTLPRDAFSAHKSRAIIDNDSFRNSHGYSTFSTTPSNGRVYLHKDRALLGSAPPPIDNSALDPAASHVYVHRDVTSTRSLGLPTSPRGATTAPSSVLGAILTKHGAEPGGVFSPAYSPRDLRADQSRPPSRSTSWVYGTQGRQLFSETDSTRLRLHTGERVDSHQNSRDYLLKSEHVDYNGRRYTTSPSRRDNPVDGTQLLADPQRFELGLNRGEYATMNYSSPRSSLQSQLTMSPDIIQGSPNANGKIKKSILKKSSSYSAGESDYIHRFAYREQLPGLSTMLDMKKPVSPGKRVTFRV